ncbi:MAG: MOSC domain-containing protein [Flavobacteriales bacterium]|nr:MOSC domain-containing protein [Flavobacteriales bacterium]
MDGLSIKSGLISSGNCLLHDREFALKDASGAYLNAKKNAKIHSLRSYFDPHTFQVRFGGDSPIKSPYFHVLDQKPELEKYLSNYFGETVIWCRNLKGEFMDIPLYSGITLVSTASLEAVAAYFGFTLEETRKRFRATIEIDGVEAFWEDRLFGKPGETIPFRLGNVKLIGMSPRERCVVPSRHPETGVLTRKFQKELSEFRKKNLAANSPLKYYPHHYYLAVDCLIADSETGKSLFIGDKLIFD